MGTIAGWFSTPTRQAAGWTALGIIGVLLGGTGLYVLLSGDDNSDALPASAAGSPSPAVTATAPAAFRTATPGPSPTGSASPSASPEPTATAESTPTAAPPTRPPSNAGQNQAPTTAPQPEATPEPTATPVVAPRAYCGTLSQTSPPNAIFGTLTIGGTNAPTGTVVTVTFDGMAGPSVATTSVGGYRVLFPAGGEECANRAGSAIGVIVNGSSFGSGETLGGSPAIRFDVALP